MNRGKRQIDCRFAGADAKDKIAINQIMLKYRPIAPKPETAQSSCRSMTCTVTSKRKKRKYVRVKKKEVTDDCKSLLNLDKSVSVLEASSGNDFVVTDPVRKVPDSISFDNNKNNIMTSNVITSIHDLHDVSLAMAVRQGKVIDSSITIESLTGTCEVGSRLGYVDEETRKNLENDSCPGFISNCYDEVQWVNLAYRRIGDPQSDGGAPPPDVVVSLGMNFEKFGLVKNWPAFSCRVRVAYQFLEKKSRMTVPCDAWKMDFGGFAWRLDVEAALSLGRLNYFN